MQMGVRSSCGDEEPVWLTPFGRRGVGGGGLSMPPQLDSGQQEHIIFHVKVGWGWGVGVGWGGGGLPISPQLDSGQQENIIFHVQLYRSP